MKAIYEAPAIRAEGSFRDATRGFLFIGGFGGWGWRSGWGGWGWRSGWGGWGWGHGGWGWGGWGW